MQKTSNGISIFLDDLRTPPPDSDYLVVKTAEEAIYLIENMKVTFISFDHDLGPGLSGHDVAKRIEELVYEGRIQCPKWTVHSANPVGRRNIKAAMESAERLQCKRLGDGNDI